MVLSRRSRQEMAQNGTKENGVAEEIPAHPLPLPVKVSSVRHTKVRGGRGGGQGALQQVKVGTLPDFKAFIYF